MPQVDRRMSSAVRAAYARGEEEESIAPLVLVGPSGAPVGRFEDGDFVIFYDIRGEREVELTAAFVDPAFDAFPLGRRPRLHFTTMVEYDRDLPVDVAFPPVERLEGTLSEVVSAAGLRQTKVTESEKAIHLAYFLNGKRKEVFAGERRIVLRSPARPLDAPGMRAQEVAAALAEAVLDPGTSLVIGNLPNVDVVGHSTDREAILRAIEAVDRALGVVLEAARRARVPVVVTADHGTVERWRHPDGAVDTGHTASPVPCVLAAPEGEEWRGRGLRDGGGLVDVAPTVLDLLGLAPPHGMTGRTLVAPAAPRSDRPRAVLLICDGWGVAPPGPGNLLAAARTPHMDALLAGRPATTLRASGVDVGLPEGTVGNSEAGHLHIGAGRVVASDRLRIEHALQDGSFFENAVLRAAAEGARSARRRLHLLGIVSFFSSHGSIEHLLALLALARRVGVEQVFVHALLGRRGERPESGAHYLERVEDEMTRLGVGRLASVVGRHWALDREQNWDRVEVAYRLLVGGAGRPVE